VVPAKVIQAAKDLHEGRIPTHYPRRGDDVEAWLVRMRDNQPLGISIDDDAPWHALNDLVDRYRECADYGLTLRPEDASSGDP
jgi:hypothetical protein